MFKTPLTDDEVNDIIDAEFDPEDLDQLCNQLALVRCIAKALAQSAGEDYDDLMEPSDAVHWDSEGFVVLAALVAAGYVRADDYFYDEDAHVTKRR